MTNVTTPSVVRQIESLFNGGSVVGLSDRQLLERFVDRRDHVAEAAFAALVVRHGPMVLTICRQLLGDRHLAEDAFQAVFLVLARKAGSIRDPDRLSAWLYGVALRTARKAKVRLMRQRRKEEGEAMHGPGAESIEPMAPPADQPAIDREQAETLHDEIDRLPGTFRMPVVLCYFEGLSLDEAARRLRCPVGTLRSRLARARDKLRHGLTRRGVVLPAAALAAVLDARPASASVSSPLCDTTTRAAIHFAAGHTAVSSATTLAQEVVKSMLFHKLKFTAMTLLLLAAFATGAGYLTHALAMKDEPKRQAAAQPRIAAKPDDTIPRPAPGRMFVVGRVRNPQGQPVPNASVMVYAHSTSPAGGLSSTDWAYPKELSRSTSDGSGRFQLDTPRTSSSSHDDFGAVALAPGYGAGWIPLDPDADQPTADITLRPEQVIEGRLFDLQGQPAGAVKLSVTAIRRVLNQGPNALPRRNFEGPAFWWEHPDDRPGWPRPVTSGADGRFTVHGVGPGLRVFLSVHDPRFLGQSIEIDTDAASTARPIRIALQPARTITGRVTYADTGKPAPHARIGISGFNLAQAGVGPRSSIAQADADGRFRVNVGPRDGGGVSAAPAEGQPYLATFKRIDWPKGAVAHEVELALPRGALIRGKVTEQGSGRPIASAVLLYVPHTTPDRAPVGRSAPKETAADGSFELAVPPYSGYLVVRGLTDDYIFQEIGDNLLNEGRPGGRRVYAHAFVACDPKPSGASPDLHVVLRRGVTVKGRVLGPDGQPVQDARMISRLHLGPSLQAIRLWRGFQQHGSARNGRFELLGLAPETEVPVHFLDPQHKLGATVRLSGKSAADEPATVRLEPCGTATARLVGPDGKPVGSLTQPRLIVMIVTPGPMLAEAQKGDALHADAGFLGQIDPINYPKNPEPDPQGRIVFPALIPGATYCIIDYTTLRDPSGPQFRKKFTVKPGETLDLGDVRIEKPSS